jgi:hypothetical protein
LITTAAGLAVAIPAFVAYNYLVSRVNGLVLEDARGWTVYFGSEGDMAQKVRVYIHIGEWLETQYQQPTMVSVVDPGSPYYSLAR